MSGTITLDDIDLSTIAELGSHVALAPQTAFVFAGTVRDNVTLGEDFASVPKEDDIAGTKRNMLSERVLDGEKYPQIRITGTGPTMTGGMQELAVKVEMLGRVIDLKVPTAVTIDGDELHAKGEFELNHADLGMKPFTALAGALQVGEKLSFTYDVTAKRAAP